MWRSNKQQEIPQRTASAPSRWEQAARAAEGGQSSYRPNLHVDDVSDDQLEESIRHQQQESLESTRRALNKLNRTEDVGQKNLAKLASQTEQLSRVEHRLDTAESKMKLSDAKVDHLKSLNKFFFLPSFGGKKVKKREDVLRKDVSEHALREAEHKENEARRLEQIRMAGTSRSSSSRNGMYSTPMGLERDQNEEEIDGNLDMISSGLGRLKMMGEAMNSELRQQDDQLRRLHDRVATTDERVQSTTHKINQVLKKK